VEQIYIFSLNKKTFFNLIDVNFSRANCVSFCFFFI
jgi:hypothetical protein